MLWPLALGGHAAARLCRQRICGLRYQLAAHASSATVTVAVCGGPVEQRPQHRAGLRWRRLPPRLATPAGMRLLCGAVMQDTSSGIHSVGCGSCHQMQACGWWCSASPVSSAQQASSLWPEASCLCAQITTIHQPSSRLFQQLDKLLLLSKVRCSGCACRPAGPPAVPCMSCPEQAALTAWWRPSALNLSSPDTRSAKMSAGCAAWATLPPRPKQWISLVGPGA